LSVFVEPVAASRSLGEYIVAPLHATRVGAGGGGVQKPFLIADIAETAH
jgi:hypothetical protein